MADTNGTTGGTVAADAAVDAAPKAKAGRTVVKPETGGLPPVGSGASLYERMRSKGANRKFGLSKPADDGRTYTARISGGLPTGFTPDAVARLASDHGLTAGVSGGVGAADGKGGCVLTGTDAAEHVRDMTAFGS